MSEYQYWTVTATFKRINVKSPERRKEASERKSELWATDGSTAVKMYKAVFYENEPNLIKGTEKFSFKKGRHLTT